MAPRLSLTDVEKSFGALKVLHGVRLTVEPGEVHGLLGENGAGKSTLLNILSGVLSMDAGTIQIDGKILNIGSPREASAAGIAMIHQELQQVPELTVAQNIFLGAALRKAGGLLVDRRAQEDEARRLLAPLDPTIDVNAPVKTLRVAQRQLVEIAKALRANAKIIAMDEPTSSLTPAEFDRLVVVVEKLAAQGVSIIYVSHKMDEVFRAVPLGHDPARRAVCRTCEDPADPGAAVIELMVGRELAQAAHASLCTDRVVLEVSGLSRGKAVQDASFKLHAGEVLGIAGLVGVGPDRTVAADRRGGPGRSAARSHGRQGRDRQGPRARIKAGLGPVARGTQA